MDRGASREFKHRAPSLDSITLTEGTGRCALLRSLNCFGSRTKRPAITPTWLEHKSTTMDDRDSVTEFGTATVPSISTASTASLTCIATHSSLDHQGKFPSGQDDDRVDLFDGSQFETLDIAHHFVTLLQRGQLFLAPIGQESNHILDVGTGTGLWAIDVADAYPSAEVMGIDLSPIQPTLVPPNCQFYIDDAELEWTYEADYFDLVHIRNMSDSIHNWQELYHQAFAAVSPGGWIEQFELGIDVHSAALQLPESHIFSKWAKVVSESRSSIENSTVVAQAKQIAGYMRISGFTNITEKNWEVPIGSWPSESGAKQIGIYNAAYMEQSLCDYAVLLLGDVLGWTDMRMQVFMSEMLIALRDPILKPYCIATCVFGQKP